MGVISRCDFESLKGALVLLVMQDVIFRHPARLIFGLFRRPVALGLLRGAVRQGLDAKIEDAVEGAVEGHRVGIVYQAVLTGPCRQTI